MHRYQESAHVYKQGGRRFYVYTGEDLRFVVQEEM
jgi:hypothetical protein